MKKLVTFFLALVMPIMLWAYDFQSGDLYYNITSNVAPYTVEVTSGNTKYSGDITIPSSVTYDDITYAVTSIGSSAFGDCSSLTSVTIPNSVTSIGSGAFKRCFFLTSVTIPNSVTSIEDFAFFGCTSLTSVTIPNSVTSIGSSAFIACSLTSVTIPNSVTSIGEYTFGDCSSLTAFIVEGDNTVYDSRENCNAIIETATNTLIAGCQSTTIPNSVKCIGDRAFGDCSSLTSVTIPNSVTSIGEWAFAGCSSLTAIIVEGDNTVYDSRENCNAIIETATNTLIAGCQSTTIPNSVKCIGDDAFMGCSSLTSVTIPNSVTSIGSSAFMGCSSLTSVTIPNSVTSIGGWAFEDTGIFNDNSNWENGVLYISNCLVDTKESLSGAYTIKDGTRIIGDVAFSNCTSLTSVTIPNSVTSIGSGAFNGCTSLTSVTIPKSVTSIGSNAFWSCSSLTSVTIPNSVTSIGSNAFWSCSSLTSVTIPSSVTSIGSNAFWSCSSLTSVTIPSSVTSIGGAAFGHCSSLNTIYVGATTPPTLVATAFRSSPSSTCYIPCGTLVAYEASDWANYMGEFVEDCIEGQQIKYTSTDGNIVTPYATDVFGANIISNTYKDGVGTITFDAPVTSLGNLAFHQCSSLVSVTIPNTVTSIGERAFWNCSSLSSITIPNGVESIGEFTFYYCSSLNAITLPNSVKTIGRDAFGYCTSLKKTNYIGDVIDWCDIVFITRETNPIYYSKSFYINDQEVKDLVIPNEVDSIHDYAFENCQSITTLTIGDGVKYVGTEAFSGCFSLKDVKMGKNIVDIGKQAFLSCSSLAVINIPTSVKTIGYQAFSHCTSLTEVEIPNGVTTIGHMAFNMCGSIVSVSLPKSLTSLGRIVFYECNSISKITVEEGNTKYDSRGICNAVIETATNTLLVGSASTIIPEGIISIETAAFRGLQALTSINIPNSVTNIGEDAFYGCPLTSITIPQNVTNIGELAFRACWSLETIYVEASTPPTLGNNAFEANSTTCYIPCGTKAAYEASDWANYMGEFVEDCIEGQQIKYTSTDGNIVTPYATDVFGANIISNTYKDGVGTITFDAPVTSIGEYAFRECTSLTSITIPNSVTSIGFCAFGECTSLTSISIPNSVTSIGTNAFIRCTSLTSVTIPDSVTSIGNAAFYNCSSLTSITIPNSVTKIGNGAFESCSSLTAISIPNSVTSIGGHTFYLCTSLTSITIPDSVTNIGEGAFFNCTKLTSLTIPQGVTSIGDRAFHCCSSLASIIVEEGNTTYDSRENCNAIIETTTNTLIAGCQNTIIPNSVTSIVSGAFSWCTSLISIAIPNGVTSIGDDTFYACDALTSITIPNSVTNIGNSAFESCSSLSSITFPNRVTSIGNDAFRNCFSLDAIYVEATTPPTLGANAFRSSPSPTCYIPCGTKAAYEASDWVNYVGEFVETYEYTLTLSSSDNSMGSATISQEPACGTPAIIIATPNDGYLFSQWSDGNTDNPRTLTVTEDIKLTAQWTPNTNIPYIVNHYRQALDGTYPSTLKETENLMGTTAANVTPVVKTYTGFTSPEAKTATIAADGSTVVEYYYTRNQYTLTWVTDGNALTGAYSKGFVLFEAAITRPNTPTKTGYTFVGWDNTVPTTMPAEDVTLTALFTIHTYSVILTADQNGTVSGGGTYNYGESVTITATPNDGYTFSQWSDGNTDNPRTLTVTEDIELTAEFEKEGNYGSYTRTVRIGYNTICLPHGSSHFTGATFYEIAHILKNKKKIFFDEVKTLEAGKPYIFYPHSTEVTIYYDNTTSAIPLSHNGLHGTFDGITAASNFLKGKYLVAGDRMVLCGDGCSLAANRAYIELDEISDKDHPAIPGIKRVSMDYSEENATTALDNITDETIVAPIQEGVYDILGRKVDAPTVSGFYIINGKKVFVMEK